MMSRLFFATLALVIFGISTMINTTDLVADDSVFSLNKRSVRIDANENLVRDFEVATWQPEQTAVIVCDVWDYHHSINAVRRLEEMLPRLNALLVVY